MLTTFARHDGAALPAKTSQASADAGDGITETPKTMGARHVTIFIDALKWNATE
ncbi:hypothetical protein PUP75_19795 [Pseudomonas chlororaphis]|uniref:hypothetical protein n=1 Tax=Pseudomonas chlororaphis TaxID=587753 RepID=UPI0023680AEE|nr:hypothetical protein [Pseudomonas chlororaphis]WDH51182.1 hypothetical protein PUP75_19795 [Pseudomonas chlororaphis]